MGLNRFGASAPYMDIYKHLNFTPQPIAERASKLVPHLIGR
jgi:transketolase